MTHLSRRRFGQLAAGAGLSLGTLSMPALGAAAPSARIVIIGGGAGGATVAARLKRAVPGLDVTLIEARSVYPTCFYSNLYLGGFRTFASLVQTYDGLRDLGVRVINETATDIDSSKKTVRLARGRPVAFDRLVLAPGIDLKYETIEGYSEATAEVMPHAWHAGPQTQLLKRQLAAMPNGGTVVLTAPPLPYRCPPAPYERACMIAHYLKTKKPKSKIILLDAKRSFTKQALFEDAFRTLYKDQIELALSNEIDDNAIARVDRDTREVVTKSGRKIVADVANIVPAQKAGAIAQIAGCAQGDWCPVQFDSFKSTLVADTYVLGDAAVAAEMPKSAFSANSQARLVSDDILAELTGRSRDTVMLTNTCWSMLGPDNSVKIGATYTAGEKDGRKALVPNGAFVSRQDEPASVRKATFEESAAWYETITSEAFAKTAAAAVDDEQAAQPARRRRRRSR